MIIDLAPIDFLSCKEFADKQLESSYLQYKGRGEGRYLKQQEDIIIGKLGELAAYKYLKHRGKSVNYPDFVIYSAKNKSYEPDMADIVDNYHIKTQPELSAKRYGYSWLLQKNDPIVIRPTANDYLILVVERNPLQFEVLGTIRATDMIWEEPKVYKDTKKAIYFDTIKDKVL